MLAQLGAVAIHHLGQAPLGALQRPGEPRAAGGEHGAELGRCGAHALVPTCRAMMPPAVSTQRTSVRPVAAMRWASSDGPGNLRTELGRYV